VRARVALALTLLLAGCGGAGGETRPRHASVARERAWVEKAQAWFAIEALG
jgi:hypothetical protein